MAANINESKEINNHDNDSRVDGNDISKKGAEIMPNIDIEENDKMSCASHRTSNMNIHDNQSHRLIIVINNHA